VDATDSSACIQQCETGVLKVGENGVKGCTAFWDGSKCYLLIKAKKKSFTKPSGVDECASCAAKSKSMCQNSANKRTILDS
jgi:chitinase